MPVIRSRLNGATFTWCVDQRRAEEIVTSSELLWIGRDIGGGFEYQHRDRLWGRPHPADVDAHDALEAEVERLAAEWLAEWQRDH